MFKDFIQKWNMFRADFGEYLRLCRQCRKLGRDIFKKRNEISVVYELGQDIKEPYCIKSVMMSFVQLPDGDSGARKNEFIDTLCPNYEKGISECSSCPRCAQKREYDNVEAAYLSAIAARRAFWRNRSQRNSK